MIAVTTEHNIDGVSLESNLHMSGSIFKPNKRRSIIILETRVLPEKQFVSGCQTSLQEDEKTSYCTSWSVHVFAFISNFQITK